jgi:autotransporter-associated beta strand protein
MAFGDAEGEFPSHMKTYDSSSSRNEERPSLANRRFLVRLLAGAAAALSFWTSQPAHSESVFYTGSGDLDDKNSWSGQAVPTSRDEAVFDVVKSDIFSTEALNFGNIVWNNNTSATISFKANGITQYLTLSGEGVGEATIKAGGAERDLLLMGESAKSNTLKFESLKGNEEPKIQLEAEREALLREEIAKLNALKLESLKGDGDFQIPVDTEREALLREEIAKLNALKLESLKGDGDFQIQLGEDGNFNVLNAEATLDISIVVTGDKSLTKTGEGTLIFGAGNTYTGATTIKSGTLKANATNALGATKVIDVQGGSLLVGASDTLNDKADILIGNAKLGMSGKDITEYVGALTLTGNSVIDVRELEGANNALHFASSFLEQGWAKNTSLSIWNWDFSGTNHIYFGTDSQGLSEAQLQQISFYSDFGNSLIGNTSISHNGEIMPIPEPQTFLVAIILVLGLSGMWMARSEGKTPQSTV